MKISELLKESEELDEYRVTTRYDPTWMINRGNKRKKEFDLKQTPLTNYNVRYNRDGDVHDYYLYDKPTDKCIGAFSIEENHDLPRSIKRLLAPGIQAVTPHMGLAPQAQRQGISTLAYSTFLQGGPWVFITEEHTVGASKLWDSLVKGDVISFYVSQQGKVLDKPDYESYRLLGPRSRFKTT